MRFLVDAQLPARLASRLVELGYDAVHTSSLSDGNRTTDQQIVAVTDRDGRIVVTKDADFRNSHLLTGSPARLLVPSRTAHHPETPPKQRPKPIASCVVAVLFHSAIVDLLGHSCQQGAVSGLRPEPR